MEDQDERLPIVAEVVREFFPHASYRVTRVTEGVSTWVYRLERDGECLYLRILPEESASFAPEVAVHRALRDAGVPVPEVVAWEHCLPALGRSVMVTTAIAGRDLRSKPSQAAPEIITQAGRDLAMINQIPVAGYGWVKRDSPRIDTLLAEHPSLSAWFAADVEPALMALRSSGIIGRQELDLLDTIVKRVENLSFAGKNAYLAHGDFDLTHIFAADDSYTGIIDFGEIRGTHPLYDLGHFAIEEHAFVSDLLSGYAEVTHLSADDLEQIRIHMVTIAARRAGRWLARSGKVYPPDIAAIRRGLAAL